MRKLMAVLVLTGLLVVLPASVGAKGKPVPDTYTCMGNPFIPDAWMIGTHTGDFHVTLHPNQRVACIDVTSSEGPWGFTITADRVASLHMHVKDSVPGDICWGETWQTKKGTIPGNWPDPNDPETTWTPTATVNACGSEYPDDTHSLVFMVSYTPEKKSQYSAVEISVNLP